MPCLTPHSPHKRVLVRLAPSALLLAALALGGCDNPDAHVVQGTIRLGPGIGRIGASDALFITARPAGAKEGPPLAVLKIIGCTFPLTYRIGQEDVMMPGTWFKGPVEVHASLRKSGFVGMKVPGDAESALSPPVNPGAKDVDLELKPAP